MTNYVAQAQVAIAAERQRQQTEEGWTPEHDDSHDRGQLAKAGACYLDVSNFRAPPDRAPKDWPFSADWWKPKTIERDLLRAGGFFQAEFDRLERSLEQESPVDHRDGAHRASRLESVVHWRAVATKRLAMLYRDREEQAAAQ